MDQPEPLVGCLICHQEGTLTLSEGRRVFGMGEQAPMITCSHCESTAFLSWEEDDPQAWRIKYRHIDAEYPYAVLRFAKQGWVRDEDALAISTDIYAQRHRVQQTQAGDLSWLSTQQLDPPPPLMHPNETVYLTLKPVTYREVNPSKIPFFQTEDDVLDTGTCYITESKIHLLGQRRDRSHKLEEIEYTDFAGNRWMAYVNNAQLYYGGITDENSLDAQLIAVIIQTLKDNAT